jgi:hypothetical protein
MTCVHCKLQFFAVKRRQQTIIALSRWHTRRRLRKKESSHLVKLFVPAEHIPVTEPE